jgi:hypothetical protein
MFLDQGRVIYNSIVNNVESTINLGIDGILSNGGQKPLVLINPNRPQVNLSGIKMDYQSEMRRRDINGKLDGNDLKRRKFTVELGANAKDIVDLIRGLNPIVRMIYRHDAANLAAWTFASHIQRDDKPKPKPPTP